MNARTTLQLSIDLKLINNNTTHMVGRSTYLLYGTYLYIYMCTLKIPEYAIQDPGVCSSCINQFRYPGLVIIAIECNCTHTICLWQSAFALHVCPTYSRSCICSTNIYGCKSYRPPTSFDRQKTHHTKGRAVRCHKGMISELASRHPFLDGQRNIKTVGRQVKYLIKVY